MRRSRPSCRTGWQRTTKDWGSLRIVPDEDTFSGSIDIEIEVREPANVIWLNATGLQLTDATLAGAAGKILPGNADFQGVSFDKPATSGRMRIRYSGVINRKDSSGIFQVKDGDDWHVYTQFESIYARRAFPCFDEPAFKVPWNLALEVKQEHSALSNTPVASETPAGDRGMKVVRFQKTKPLPSYLVAFAVGSFELVAARAASVNKTPVRVIVPKGRKAEAEYAASITPDIIEQLEKYFEIPFPYPKADSIAVPLLGDAMENAGLVTYDQSLILSKPSEDSIQRQRSTARLAAHNSLTSGLEIW